jgi:hypothetical protein
MNVSDMIFDSTPDAAVPELLFEKKGFIPALQQLITTNL